MEQRPIGFLRPSDRISLRTSRPTKRENFITHEHSGSIIKFYKFIQDRAKGREGAIVPGRGIL